MVSNNTLNKYKLKYSLSIRYEEDGKLIFHKSEVNVILDEEVDIPKIPKGLMKPRSNMKQKVNRQRRRRRRKPRSDKFNSVDLVSSNVCNMTVTQEIVEEGTCSYFGSFCKYSGDRLKYNEVMQTFFSEKIMSAKLLLSFPSYKSF